MQGQPARTAGLGNQSDRRQRAARLVEPEGVDALARAFCVSTDVDQCSLGSRLATYANHKDPETQTQHGEFLDHGIHRAIVPSCHRDCRQHESVSTA